MNTKNSVSNKTASTKATTVSTSKKHDAHDQAKNLVAQLRRDGALFLSNGAYTFMVLDNEVVYLGLYTVDEMDKFLSSRKYLEAIQPASNTFWGSFLDEIENNESILLQARLWELGEKQACADAAYTVSLGDDGTKETILDIVKRFGDKLAKQG
jgi:hypothetical protein